MKKLLTLLFLLILASPIFSQTCEYGEESELKGLKKVHIDVGSQLEEYKRIVSMIKKAKVDLEIVDDEEDAEIMLIFASRSRSVVTGTNTNTIGDTNVTTVNKAWRVDGAGGVFIKGNKKPCRQLMEFEGTQRSKLFTKPSKKFAKKFIKVWEKANKSQI